MATYRKTKAGTWEVRVKRKGHRPLYSTWPRKSQAETWARRKEDLIVQGKLRDYAKAEATTLHAGIARYRDEITPRKASQQSEISRLGILDRELGHLTFIELTAQEVVSFVDRRLKTGVTSETVRKEMGTLSQLYKTARALWGIDLPENPVSIAREILSVTRTLKPGQERIRRLQPATPGNPGEYKKLMKHARRSVKDIIDFAIETAMRRTEIFKAGPQHRAGNKLRIPETKTQKPRTIPLSKKAAAILDKRTKPGQARYFMDLQPDSITYAFRLACQSAGIKDLVFHDLRHEAISRLFEKGLRVQEVAAISGHSDWRSLKRYTHVLPDNIAKKLF